MTLVLPPEDVELALAEIEAAILELNPTNLPDGESGWQQRKSAQTRVALLEAAVACLSDEGYARFTTQSVASRAGISRGAMLHHFATKAALIAKVIDFVMYRRMIMFREHVTKLTDAQRIEEGKGVEIYWQTVLTPEYQALMELSMASRTDKDLRKVYDKKARAFDDLWTRQTPVLFPEWANVTPEKLSLARDLITTTLEGLSLNRNIMTERARRVAVRDFIMYAVTIIREQK